MLIKDAIEKTHFEDARRILETECVQRSHAFCEGKMYALAWCLAGKPKPTPSRNRDTACEYRRGTPERDAWQAGWGVGHKTAVQMGLVKSPGAVYEIALPQGGHVLVTEPHVGLFSWEVTSNDGCVLHKKSDYLVLAIALCDALNEALK